MKSKFIGFDDPELCTYIIERSITLRYFVSRLRNQIFRKMHDFRLLLSVHKSRRSNRLARATLAPNISRRFSNEIRFSDWSAENIILLDGIRKPIDAFQHKSHTSSTNGRSFSLVSLYESHKLSPIFAQVESKEDVVAYLATFDASSNDFNISERYYQKVTKMIFWNLTSFYCETNSSPVPKYLFLNPLLICWGKKCKMRETAWENFTYCMSEKEITEYFLFFYIAFYINFIHYWLMKQTDTVFILYFICIFSNQNDMWIERQI